MGLEDLLLSKIDANLHNKREVILKYGRLIDRMREYSFSNSLENALAKAFNLYKKADVFKPSDFEGYSLAHTPEAIQAYEEKFGLKTFVFDVVLPKQKWGRFLRKAGEPRWAGGLCYPHNDFYGFFHGDLMFGTFGIIIECEPANKRELVEHEALHCDRNFYSSHWDELKNFRKFLHYDAVQTAAKTEASLADEMLCFLATGWEKAELTKMLRKNYLPAEAKDLYNHFEANSAPEKERVKKWLRPLRHKVDLAVDAAYSIKEKLEFSVMVPLFFSFGAAKDEMAAGNYGSAFNDIIMLADLLDRRILDEQRIIGALQAKGYLLRQPEYSG